MYSLCPVFFFVCVCEENKHYFKKAYREKLVDYFQMPSSPEDEFVPDLPLICPHLQVSEELLKCFREKEQSGEDYRLCVHLICSKHIKKALVAKVK